MYSALQFQLARLADRGFATGDILHGTGLLRRQLEDPWPHLGQEQYSALVRNIQHLSGDPAIGLQLNRELRLSHLGLPGFAALTSPTFGAARKLVMRYRVLKDPAVFPRHQLTRDSWTMTLEATYPLAADIQRFAIEGHLARTLRRKLLVEHTSFQRIVSEVRRDLALYYLRETSLPTKQVAFSLGYSTVSNFHRAFKEWTGQRISAMRLCD